MVSEIEANAFLVDLHKIWQSQHLCSQLGSFGFWLLLVSLTAPAHWQCTRNPIDAMITPTMLIRGRYDNVMTQIPASPVQVGDIPPEAIWR